MLENGFHKKLTHEVWLSPRVVRLLLNVNWVLLSEESYGVRHQFTSHSSTNPLHELFGQTTYMVSDIRREVRK